MAGRSVVLYGVQQNFYTSPGKLWYVLPDGCQLWHQKIPKRQAVHAHDGYIFRNPQSGIIERPDGADGHYVSRCQYP